MKSNQNRLRTVSTLLIAMIVVLTGCHTGGFKRPDFGRLAFWKNDELRLASRTDDLPPPSTHFAPEPTNMGPVSKNSVSPETKAQQEIQARVDRMLANARKSKSENSDPIRKPYGTEADSQEKPNRFPFNMMGKSDDISADARNDIQAKLDALKEHARQRSEESNNEFSADASRDIDATKPVAGWKNDFQLPIAAGQRAQNNSKMETGSAEDSFDPRQTAGNATTGMSGAISKARDASNQTAANRMNDANRSSDGTSNNSFQPKSIHNTRGQMDQGVTGNRQNVFEPLGSATKSLARSTGETLQQATTAAHATASIVADDLTQRVAQAHDQVGNLVRNTTSDIPVSLQRGRGTTAKINYPTTPKADFEAAPLPRYPSTPYGELESRSAAMIASAENGKGATVENGNTTFDPQVKQTGGSTDIPAALLQGSSTFAPGSVKQLKPIDDNWSPPSSEPGN